MIHKDFDSRRNNIDLMLDTLKDIKENHDGGISLEEAIFDPVTKVRLNRFKKQKLQRKGVNLDNYSIHTTNSSNSKIDKDISNIERGVFVYSEDDLVVYDDGDGCGYVCEYCVNIGYDGAYRPEVCDICDECSGCTEYMNGECDGCSYCADYNNGSTYGEVTNQKGESFMVDEDVELLHELKEDNGDDTEVYGPNGDFSIMDY